jgi:tape measure domain-containing protein
MANEKYKFTIDADTLDAIKKLRNLGDEARKVGDESERAGKKAAGAWEVFKGVLGANALVGAFRGIASAASGAFDSIIDATKKTEKIKTELQVMTGSVEAAEAAYRQLQNFAAATPFELEGVAGSAKQLIAFGFSVDSITDKLKIIGDVAAGSGKPLNEVTQIFGQVAAAGKLTGERLNQLQEAAIPIGPALAKTMGVAESSIRDLVSNGQVSFKDFEKAFSSLAQQGGVFFDGMKKQSETLEGRLSSLSDTFSESASNIGSAFLPVLKEVVTSIDETIKANREAIKAFSVRFGEQFQEFFKTAVENGKAFVQFLRDNAELLAFVGTALGVAAAGWAAYATAVTAASIAQAAFAAVNPVVLALGAATLAIAAAIRYWDELKISFYGTIAAMADLASNIPGLGESMSKLAEEANAEMVAIQAAKDAKEADAASTVTLSEAKAAATDANIATRTRETEAMETANKQEQKAAQDHAKKLEEIRIEQAVAAEEARILKNEAENIETSARLERLVEELGREEGIRTEARLRILTAEQQTANVKRQIQLTEEEAKKKSLERQIEDQRLANDGLLTLNQQYDAKLAENQKKKDEEAKRRSAEERKQRDGDLLYFMNTKDREADWAEKTEREKLDTVRGSFSTLAQLSRDGNKQLGEIGKAAAISGATIDTYKAATGAYSALAGIPVVGPALGAAAAAAAIVAGMANVRAISSQRFERGGIVAGSSYTGDNIGVRVNSGELILNRAQQKNLAPQLMGQDNSDVVAAITLLREDVRALQLTIGDEEVFNAVNRQVQAGRQL